MRHSLMAKTLEKRTVKDVSPLSVENLNRPSQAGRVLVELDLHETITLD